MRSARRLVREVVVRGRGLHTGEAGGVRVMPGERGAGLFVGRSGAFVRLRPELALADAARCTALAVGGEAVRTVEHLLAALVGCGIGDARIEFSGPEVPILDGSARPWVEMLGEASEADEAGSAVLAVAAAVALRAAGAVYRVEPAARPEIALRLDVVHPRIGVQRVSWDGDAEVFAARVAPARTWALREEVEAILAAGLARGGSLDCAVVLDRDGPLGGPLRFPDEPARHKLLDLVGDLALLGALPRARVQAWNPSHAANRVLVHVLAGSSYLASTQGGA